MSLLLVLASAAPPHRADTRLALKPPPPVTDYDGDPTVLSILQRYGADVDASLVTRSLRMTSTAANAWAAHVLNNTRVKRYFEWGSGGSTEAVSWAVKAGHLEAYSVDSSEPWLEKLRKDSGLIRAAESTGTLHLMYANVGEVGEWGMPADWDQKAPEEQREMARAYVETPLTQASGKFDAVLVDGRWRLACGLAALRALKPTSRVMVHDYFEEAGRSHAASHHTERGEYDKLLPWYDLVEEARELAVFAPKEEVLSGLRNGTLTDKYEKAIEGAYHNAMRLNQHDAISPPRHARV